MNKLFPFFLFLGLSVFGADLPSTSYTRDFLRADTAAEARGKLGIVETNMSVSLMPDATQFTTNSGILALVANPTNFLQNVTPTHETLFTLPTDDPTKLGVLHPTVWYGATNWNGWRYWLFYSTWPGVEREAMFCAVSRDGTSWYPAPGTTTGQIGPNSADPEVVMLDDGSLCVYYLYAGVGGTTNNIDYLRSFDGVTWTTNRAFTVTNALAIGSAACPSIVRLADNTYRMWWHDKTTNGDATDGDPYSMAQIYTMTSPDGLAWDLATKATCPGMTNGWHFDVARIGDTLYMLRCNEMPLSHGPPKVWTSAASDGTNWTHVPGFGLVLPQGLVGPYRADLTPTAAWPPTFDVWWNNWDGYSATADATNSTQRVGRMQGVTLPMQPLDWTRSNTLTMANSFFSSQSSSSTVMPFAYPWSVAGEGALNFKYVANLGTGGLLYTNAASAWGIFGLDAFGYKYDAAGSLGGGLFQSYETMPKAPSQFRIEWQVKLLTNSAAQIGLYKYGTFGSSLGTLTNIMVRWDTTGTNMAYLCVTNGSTSQRVAFDGVPSVAGTSHTLESTLVTIEKTEWGKVTAKLYRYPTTYTATATFADTTALWWTPFVAWKGTVAIERFDLRTKVNNARGGASDLPSAAVLSANAISMMTNGPITGTFVGDVVSSGVSQFADTTNTGSAYLSGPIHSYGGHVMHGGNLTAGSTDATFASVTAGTLTGDELSVSNVTASGTISGDGSGLTKVFPIQYDGKTNISVLYDPLPYLNLGGVVGSGDSSLRLRLTNSGNFIDIDSPNGVVDIGDVVNAGNSTHLQVSDAVAEVFIGANTLRVLTTNGVINTSATSEFEPPIISIAPELIIESPTLNLKSLTTRIGDYLGHGNGTTLTVDDNEMTITAVGSFVADASGLTGNLTNVAAIAASGDATIGGDLLLPAASSDVVVGGGITASNNSTFVLQPGGLFKVGTNQSKGLVVNATNQVGIGKVPNISSSYSLDTAAGANIGGGIVSSSTIYAGNSSVYTWNVSGAPTIAGSLGSVTILGTNAVTLRTGGVLVTNTITASNLVASAGGLTLPVLTVAPAVSGNNAVLWISNSAAPVLWITTTNGTFAH